MSYLDFYGLQVEPFRITPDPEFLYLSPSHKEALGVFLYGISKRKGILAIIGEVGVGKTTILRSYLKQIDPEKIRLIYLFNPNLTFEDLIQTLCEELGVKKKSDRVFDLLNDLHRVLIEEYSAGRNVVLVVDEAQNIPYETLENLRMLSNLETNTEKLIQIVLIGQPELEQKLNEHRLRQLRQRVAVRSTILPLTEEESREYVESRIKKCQVTPVPVFSKRAMKTLVKNSGGIPRVMNTLCDNALITGYGYQQRPIRGAVIREVLSDLHGLPFHSYRPWIFRALLTIVMLLITYVLFRPPPPEPLAAYSENHKPRPQAIASKPIDTKPAETKAESLNQEQLQIPPENTVPAPVLEPEPPRVLKKTLTVKKSKAPLVKSAPKTFSKDLDDEIAEERRRKIQFLLQKSEALQKQQAAIVQQQAKHFEEKPQTPESVGSTDISSEKDPVSISEPAPSAKPEAPAELQKPKETSDIQKIKPKDQVFPRAIHTIAPKYPPSGFVKGMEGNVTLKILVTETGSVAAVHVVRGLHGDGLFAQSAVAAVRNWRFSPGTLNGVPSKMWMTYTVRFRIQKTR